MTSLRIELKPHSCNKDLRVVAVKVHPVTEKLNVNLGYLNVITGGFGYIANHQLREHHQDEIEALIEKELKAHADLGTNPSGEGPRTGGGDGS